MSKILQTTGEFFTTVFTFCFSIYFAALIGPEITPTTYSTNGSQSRLDAVMEFRGQGYSNNPKLSGIYPCKNNINAYCPTLKDEFFASNIKVNSDNIVRHGLIKDITFTTLTSDEHHSINLIEYKGPASGTRLSLYEVRNNEATIILDVVKPGLFMNATKTLLAITLALFAIIFYTTRRILTLLGKNILHLAERKSH